jgi:hypothetical protein
MRLRRTLLLAGLLAAPAHPARDRPGAAPRGRAAPAAEAPLDSARRRTLRYWPSDPFWSTRAPDTVLVDIETTRGPITVVLRRAWAPHGVDRAYNLAAAGYFDDSRFYRVVDGFVAQFGLAGDPRIAGVWSRRRCRPTRGARRTPGAPSPSPSSSRTTAPRTCSSTCATTRASTRSASRRSGAS